MNELNKVTVDDYNESLDDKNNLVYNFLIDLIIHMYSGGISPSLIKEHLKKITDDAYKKVEDIVSRSGYTMTEASIAYDNGDQETYQKIMEALFKVLDEDAKESNMDIDIKPYEEVEEEKSK